MPLGKAAINTTVVVNNPRTVSVFSQRKGTQNLISLFIIFKCYQKFVNV